MAIRISRREVLNNIIRLKDNLSEKKEETRQQGIRFYPALLNRHSGDLRFIEQSGSFHLAEDWMEIQIDVEAEGNGQAHFEARDEKHRPLKPQDLDPLAWRILAETLETLNSIASEHLPKKPDVLPEVAALEDLSDIHLSELAGMIEEMSGWQGSIDRFEAEKRLKTVQPGVYLVRSPEPLIQVLAKNLSEANNMMVKAYLVTMKDYEQKVDERLILQTNRGWTAYRDNPDLSDSEYSYYHSPEEAIRKLEPRAKKPLKD